MRPGFSFELTQHFEHDSGSVDNRQFLLMSIEHRGSNNYLTGNQAGYANKFYCVRKKIKFRPQLVTLTPTINGPQTAIPFSKSAAKADPLGARNIAVAQQRVFT